MLKKILFLLPLCCQVITGCLREDLTENTPSLEVGDIVVPADVEVGKVTGTVPVFSNQSWSVISKGDCSWARFSNVEHLNPSNITDSSAVQFAVDDNDSYEPRSFQFEVSGPSLSKTVTVTQLAKVNRLRVNSDELVFLAPEPGPQTLDILSNVSWSASVVPGRKVGGSIAPESGNGDGSVVFTPEPNYEIGRPDTVSVKIVGEGMEPVIVRYVLGGNEPFLRVDDRTVRTYLPISESGTVYFLSNDGWTARIMNSTIQNLVLEASEGESGQNELSLSFDKNESMERRTASLEIRLKNYPETVAVVDIEQIGGFALFVDFSNGNQPLRPSSESVPEISTKAISNPLHPNAYLFTQEGVDYKFTIRNDSYSYGTSDELYGGYLLLSKGSICLPAIEGMKLISVQFLHAATNKTFSITEDDYGKVVTDGGVGYQIAKYATAYWMLTATQEGTSYYLYHSTEKARIVNITLIYE